MKFQVLLVSLFFVIQSVFAAVEKFTVDIKDNGEHCQASIEGEHTRLDIFADKQKRTDNSLLIQQKAVLQRSAVNGLCVLRGSERLFVVLTNTGKIIDIPNPGAMAENNAGTQLAIEYFDQGKRAVYFITPAGKEAVVPFSNYSRSGLGYGYQRMKFTPDDRQLMIIEGEDFAESMLLISTSAANMITIKQVPARLANQHQGQLEFIDEHRSIFADDKATVVITDFSTEQQLHVPQGYRFVGSMADHAIFMKPDSLLLYHLTSQSFGREIALPTELSQFIRANALEYLELQAMTEQRLLLKTTGPEWYLFQLSDFSVKKLINTEPCSVSGAYCLQ